MASCQGCGSEIIGRDRFCRKCGAPVAVSVADLVDTRQLNPNAPPHAGSAPGSHEFTAQFYTPPAAYPPGAGVAPAYQTGSLKKRSGTWKIILLVVVLMCAIFAATGIIISTQGRRNRNIPAETSRRSFQNAVRNGLGFEAGNLSEQEFPGVSGVFIDALASDLSPAAVAKWEAGDVLMALNDQAVQNIRDLAQLLEPLAPGTEVPVQIFRDGQTLTLPIKVANTKFAPPLPEPRDRDQGMLGIDDIGSRKYILSAQKWGVTIQAPSNNGPADLAGLQRGDIITEFNGYPVRTRLEFQRRIRAAKPRTKVQVKFYRGDVEQTVEVLMGHRG